MEFSELLDDYLYTLRISSKELAEAAGISPAAISRYKSGERRPIRGRREYNAIIDGIVDVAEKKNIQEINRSAVEESFDQVFANSNEGFDEKSFRTNLDQLMTAMDISAREIADCTGRDISYISRIRSGDRRPADPHQLITAVTEYIMEHYYDTAHQETISGLLDCRLSDMSKRERISGRLYRWLFYNDNSPRTYIEDFIHRLDIFDISSYSSIRQQSASSRQISTSEMNVVAYGVDRLRELRNNYLEYTILRSENKYIDIVWNLSDISGEISDELNDRMNIILSSGFSVRIIHVGGSPIEEIMETFKDWMPLFLSGQIESYYIDSNQPFYMVSSFIVSDCGMISIDGLSDDGETCRVYTSTSEEEIDYYSSKFDRMLEHSRMMVELISDSESRNRFLDGYNHIPGVRKELLSTPPIYTISDELLDRILERNRIAKSDRAIIRSYIKQERDRFRRIAEISRIEDHIPNVSREDYDTNPVFLSLSGLFYDRDIFYTYDEYVEHMRLAKMAEAEIENYSLVLREDMNYRKIQIFMNKGSWVMVSKNQKPAVHFIIRHPAIRNNLEILIENYN